MKKAVRNFRLAISIAAACAAAMLGGCRQDVKYFLYYPHPILNAVQPSADWQEFDISPLRLEEKEFLVVTFKQDERTLCQNDISAYHLCSPAAQAEYERQLEKLRALPDNLSDQAEYRPNSVRDDENHRAGAAARSAIELLTESGEVEIYERRFYGGAKGQILPFDFHQCNYTVWNRAKLDAGADREIAEYSDAEKKMHHRACEESHRKTFVKMLVLSPTKMNVESIKLENYYDPFSIR